MSIGPSDGVLSTNRTPPIPVPVVGLACLVVASAGTLLVALGNQVYFSALTSVVNAGDPVTRALLFSSWLVLLGAPFAIRWPREMGFRFGSFREHWRLVTAVTITAALVTAGILTVTDATPYSEASALIESVVVPITEELVFRGVVLTALLAVLGRFLAQRPAASLAILINGAAFGIGHLANATSLPLGFVLGQALFAAVLGSACAYLVVRTRSIYPAMILHAAVNTVVIAW